MGNGTEEKEKGKVWRDLAGWEQEKKSRRNLKKPLEKKNPGNCYQSWGTSFRNRDKKRRGVMKTGFEGPS